MKAIIIAYLTAAMISLMGCQKNNSQEQRLDLFDSVPVAHPLVPILNEISGIADSRINPGYIWGHEDSGSPAVIHLIGHDGQVLKSLVLKDAVNRDWEDIALAGGQLYIGEIGDNSEVFPAYFIYRFMEPSLATDTVNSIEKISFSYPDGSHDAEAFLVDSATRDIFIITKQDNPSRIYKLAYPYIANNVVSLAGSLGYSGVVGACITPDGSEIIIKTYGQLYHYKRKTGQDISQALQNSYTPLKYEAEPQGEAISFARDNSGFYTLSEKAWASIVKLHFYKRK